MRQDRVLSFIQRAYGRKYNLPPVSSAVAVPRYYFPKVRSVAAIATGRSSQIIVGLIITVILMGSIIYFNILIQTEQDVLAARGKVDALQQRRNDISVNLSKAVLDYSRHEQSVFEAVVSIRSILPKKESKNRGLEEPPGKAAEIPGTGSHKTASMAAADSLEKLGKALGSDLKGSSAAMVAGTGLLSPLDRLMAIAEQYPDLKLSANFQSLMTALIEVEKDLATERIRYNDTVNLYTTTLYKFPTNFFAFIFGFESMPYFEATEDARRFVPIDY